MRTIARHRILATVTALAIGLPTAAVVAAAGNPVAAQDAGFDPTSELAETSEVLTALPDGIDPPPLGDPVAAGLQIAHSYAAISLPAGSGLAGDRAEASNDGGQVIRVEQTMHGLPVFASGVAVRVDAAGNMKSLSSDVSQQTVAATTPAVADADAVAAAVSDTASRHELPVESLAATGAPVLTVYDPNLVGGDPNAGTPARLVWDVSVAHTEPGVGVAQRVLVNADTGTVDLSFNSVPNALNREVQDCNHQVIDFADATPCKISRREGGPAVGDNEVDHAFNLSGMIYHFYKDRFGRDSYDNKGSKVVARVRTCRDAACDRAFWSPTTEQMIFSEPKGQSEDIVAHEFTHGVVQFTANLSYYAESGAIDEMMAQSFGEIADLANNPPHAPGNDDGEERWVTGEDMVNIGHYPAAISMKNPASQKRPDRMRSPYYSSDYDDRWGVHNNGSVGEKATFLIAAGGSFNGHNVTGIGLEKTAAVLYEALTGLMTPATDYADLYRILPAACQNLVGARVGPAGAKQTVQAVDCQSVVKAVKATQMNLPGRGTNQFAPTCRKFEPRGLFLDNAEGDTGKLVASSNQPEKWNWTRTRDASESGDWSWGAHDPASQGTNAQRYYTPDFTLTTKEPVYIPNGSDSFLLFRHTYDFASEVADRGNDGGVVEYAFTPNGPWKDLADGRATNNGYNGEVGVEPENDPAYWSPLEGRRAFVSQSNGFVRTRLRLNEFAGRELFFRFRAGHDAAGGGGTGWFIDDIMVADCPDPANTPPADPPGFLATSPKRLFDTRVGEPQGLRDVAKGQSPAGNTIRVNTRGLPGSLQSTSALSLNVTAVNTSGPGYVTVYPCGNKPDTSTVNFAGAGQLVANGVTVPVSDGKDLCVFTSASTDVFVDVNGYYTDSSGLRPTRPKRMFDTRGPAAGHLTTVNDGKLGAGKTIKVNMRGLDGTPANLGAVLLNVTTTDTNGPGYVTVFPCGTRPDSSNVNFTGRGQTVANGVIAPVNADGEICMFAKTGTHVIADVNGYFVKGKSMHPLVPGRILDTRGSGRVGPSNGDVLTLDMSNARRIPGDAKAAVLNVTATGTGGDGFVTVYPCGTRPTASNLNFVAGQTVANSVIAPISKDRKICLFAKANTHLVADISGYLTTR